MCIRDSQETVERESRKGKLYDDLNRCYTLQFTYGDQSKTYYFIMVPEDDMDPVSYTHLDVYKRQTFDPEADR